MNIMTQFLCFVLLTITPFVTSFSWKNCGDNSDSVQISTLSVFQNSTKSIIVKAYGNVTQDLIAPIKLDMLVQKKIWFGWMFVPCVDDIGSCDIIDVCALSPYKDVCPPEFMDQNVPCFCPVAKGTYSGSFPVNLANTKVPSWLESGSYRVKATLSSQSSRLLCISFDIKLK